MQTPEHKEKQKVKTYLTQIGAYQFWPVVTGWGRPTLDCLACINGQFWGIEVKSAIGKLTARQKSTVVEMNACGVKIAYGTADDIISAIRRELVLSPKNKSLDLST